MYFHGNLAVSKNRGTNKRTGVTGGCDKEKVVSVATLVQFSTNIARQMRAFRLFFGIIPAHRAADNAAYSVQFSFGGHFTHFLYVEAIGRKIACGDEPSMQKLFAISF